MSQAAIPATDVGTDAAPKLKRVLGVPSLVLFGLVYMVPLTVFTTYGIVTEMTGGRVAVSYVITLVAMLFTARSYARMSVAYPYAGSAYVYGCPYSRTDVSADVSASIVANGASTCNDARLDAVSGYFAEAHPVSVGISGQRAFATDTRGSLYSNMTGAIIVPGMSGASPLH